MESLKALVAQKRREKDEEFSGRRFLRRSELEEKRLKRLRETEEKELRLKKSKSGTLDDDDVLTDPSQDLDDSHVPNLSPEEVIRRLRLLNQPATLFGEVPESRLLRLMKAEREMHIEDDTIGDGDQTNIFTEMQREEKQIQQQARNKQMMEQQSNSSSSKQAITSMEDQDETLKYFEQAAKRLEMIKEETDKTMEDKILQQVSIWCEEWKQDLDSRSEEVKSTQTGNQTTMVYKQNMKWMQPLFDRLKARSLDEEIVNGLWTLVRAMRARNYQEAYECYLRLAIGNAPWPIGVTSVGIHERSAREKISHTRNVQGQAHIMNDEATRKYLQGIKRLMTFVQRAYPANPSRSVDFSTFVDPGKGVAGRGSDRLALAQAEASGVGPDVLALEYPSENSGKETGGKVAPAPRTNAPKRGRQSTRK
eukprot:g4745.t1